MGAREASAPLRVCRVTPSFLPPHHRTATILSSDSGVPGESLAKTAYVWGQRHLSLKPHLLWPLVPLSWHRPTQAVGVSSPNGMG